MALNSRNRRGSAMNHGSPWRGMLPDPEGSVSADDRAQLAYLYGGLFSGDVAETPDPYAWFPGDRIPTGRRYEEYGEEEKPRRRRKPVEVIKDLVPLPPFYVDVPGYEELPQMVPPPEFGGIPEAPELPAPQVDPAVAQRFMQGQQAQQVRESQRSALQAKAQLARPQAMATNPEAKRLAFHAKALQAQQSAALRYQQLTLLAGSKRP